MEGATRQGVLPSPLTLHHSPKLRKEVNHEEWQELPLGDWTANPDRCRYGCADGIGNDQLYGLRARGILNHQLKREGCAESTVLSFWAPEKRAYIW